MTNERGYTTRTTCRVCGSAELESLFSLGDQFVSDFVPAGKVLTGPRCPIELVLCRRCTLVQQQHTAPQDFLYTRHYWYRSNLNPANVAALADVARAAERVAGLKPGDVVLDIGSNTGNLLRSYTVPELFRVGIEPATNLAKEGRQGIELLIQDFWSYKAWQRVFGSTAAKSVWRFVEGGPRAAVITACGMFYDTDDPNSFIADVAKVLAPDGVFIAQLMCLKQTVEQGDVGNLVSEHLEFYSLVSLSFLFGQHGLEIFDIEENNVNGGSYRLFIRHKGSGVGTLGPGAYMLSVGKYAAIENGLELYKPATYRYWFARVQANRDRCVDFIRKEVAARKRVWIYGASTKGNVISQWYGLDTTLIEAAADRSPEKVGLHMVGTGIPIRSEEEFRRAKPDYALCLPYAFREEFLVREQEWRKGGGKFIFPLPTLEVV